MNLNSDLFSQENITNNEIDIVLACCRDEDDIVLEFIDFYLDMGFDLICLVDNGSQDSTVRRILQHPAQDRIRLVQDQRIGHDKLLLDYYNYFVAKFNRWCFFIDLDEFIFIPGGIKHYARSLPPEVTVLRLSTVEMLPANETELAVHPLLRSARQANPWEDDPKKFIWKNVKVSKVFGGKHKVELEPYVEYQDQTLFIRHYYARSESQFNRKLINRLESLSSLGEAEIAQFVAFPPESFEHYLTLSQQLLEANAWVIEKERLLTTDWIADSTVKDWFLARYSN